MTNEQRAVLAHVVLDPDAWWAHCQSVMGSRAGAVLAEKVARHQASYDAAFALGGYQTRAEREAG